MFVPRLLLPIKRKESTLPFVISVEKPNQVSQHCSMSESSQKLVILVCRYNWLCYLQPYSIQDLQFWYWWKYKIFLLRCGTLQYSILVLFYILIVTYHKKFKEFVSFFLFLKPQSLKSYKNYFFSHSFLWIIISRRWLYEWQLSKCLGKD